MTVDRNAKVIIVPWVHNVLRRGHELTLDYLANLPEGVEICFEMESSQVSWVLSNLSNFRANLEKQDTANIATFELFCVLARKKTKVHPVEGAETPYSLEILTKAGNDPRKLAEFNQLYNDREEIFVQNVLRIMGNNPRTLYLITGASHVFRVVDRLKRARGIQIEVAKAIFVNDEERKRAKDIFERMRSDKPSPIVFAEASQLSFLQNRQSASIMGSLDQIKLGIDSGVLETFLRTSFVLPETPIHAKPIVIQKKKEHEFKPKYKPRRK